jgi:hypothetical protein
MSSSSTIVDDFFGTDPAQIVYKLLFTTAWESNVKEKKVEEFFFSFPHPLPFTGVTCDE